MRKVLIFQDSTNSIEELSSKLKALRFEVIVCTNLVDAYQKTRDGTTNCVIVDLDALCSAELLVHTLNIFSTVPILLVSTHCSNAKELSALNDHLNCKLLSADIKINDLAEMLIQRVDIPEIQGSISTILKKITELDTYLKECPYGNANNISQYESIELDAVEASRRYADSEYIQSTKRH